ncbi:Protein of unknown function DUF1676 [Cinara cedri]|uniref:Osiris 20 n=1 Tax=Cinara cedri TaxID=506608 RepID=A0A5E4NJ64_9HEMI|nr:Protein of unknown function DUF1676 [Cinara cedri]
MERLAYCHVPPGTPAAMRSRVILCWAVGQSRQYITSRREGVANHSFRMYRITVVSVSLVLLAVAAATAATAAAVAQQATGDNGGSNLLDRVLDKCALGPGAVSCLKSNVLDYLQDGVRKGRSTTGAPEDMDAELIRAAGEYVGRQIGYYDGLEESRAEDGQQQQQQTTTTTTARADMEMGMMQDKMLMPLMMLMKMKMKMLMPIMMAMVSMKATKALILSKVAVLLVLGFLVKEFLKKSGGIPGLPLHLPGMMPAAPEPSSTVGPPMYGPPQSSGYESSASWEPTGYSSSAGHTSDSAHSMAYSSYLPSSSSSSSASSSASKYS